MSHLEKLEKMVVVSVVFRTSIMRLFRRRWGAGNVVNEVSKRVDGSPGMIGPSLGNLVLLNNEPLRLLQQWMADFGQWSSKRHRSPFHANPIPL